VYGRPKAFDGGYCKKDLIVRKTKREGGQDRKKPAVPKTNLAEIKLESRPLVGIFCI
jgi:hypothetical protein